MGSSFSGAIDRLPKLKGPPLASQVLFESASDAIMTTDSEGQILEVNAETGKQFGYDRQELIGEPVEKLIPRRFREAHQHHRAA